MKARNFERLAKANRLRGATLDACRLVLVDGESAYAASNITGRSQSTISRALAKMARGICETCGQPKALNSGGHRESKKIP